jgi:uncharacterized protein YcgL (UPF0745 family)
MECFIYKSLKKADTYLYVPQKDDFDNVPETLRAMLGRMEFVMELELRDDRKLAQADARQVKQQLKEQGFYLQLPPSNIPGRPN